MTVEINESMSFVLVGYRQAERVPWLNYITGPATMANAN